MKRRVRTTSWQASYNFVPCKGRARLGVPYLIVYKSNALGSAWSPKRMIGAMPAFILQPKKKSPTLVHGPTKKLHEQGTKPHASIPLWNQAEICLKINLRTQCCNSQRFAQQKHIQSLPFLDGLFRAAVASRRGQDRGLSQESPLCTMIVSKTFILRSRNRYLSRQITFDDTVVLNTWTLRVPNMQNHVPLLRPSSRSQ